MNFYNLNIRGKDYYKILQSKETANQNKQFILQNFGMLVGNKSFYRILKCFDLLRQTKKIKGDIIEFGIWNGNNLFTLKKIIDYLNIKKKIIGFDNFSGLPNPTLKEKPARYKGNKNLINFIIKFFKLKNINIIDDDILNLIKYRRKIKKLSFVYIDCDIYKVVKAILNEINSKISKGGIIAFDEANRGVNNGEKKALNEFYNQNKAYYKKIFLKKNYQPDVVLLKIK